MILGIICFILSCLGVYGFYSDYYILTYIGFVFCFFENLLGRFSDTSKPMITFWLSCFIGWIVVDDFFLGISVGACFENIVMFVGGLLWIIYLFYLINKKDSTNLDEADINDNQKSVNEEINIEIVLEDLYSDSEDKEKE